MVRSKPGSSKKPNRGVDFKKIKRKIGRKLPPPKNFTDTQIKSKAIVLPEQSVASERVGLVVNKKGLTLRELLQQTSHHNAKIRKAALTGIRDIVQKHPSEFKLHKVAIIEKLRERICDTDKVVRETLYHLLKTVIFPCSKEEITGPFVSLLMAYIFNAMTHMAVDIRLMAFKFFELVVLTCPSSFILYAEKVLDNYMDILRNNQIYLQDKRKLKNALGGLVHCFSLLVRKKGEDDPLYEPKIAEQRRLHNFETEVPKDDADKYHFGWRDQLGTSFTQLQIVNALRLGERERASKMLLNLGNVNGSLSADDFAYILDYCAQTPDPLFVMETWKIMEEKAIDVSRRSCRSIVLSFIRGGYYKEAFNWLTFVGENNFVHPILPLYDIFLSECGKTQSLIDADRCLEMMEDRLLGKSEITYWELLKLAVLQNNLSAVHDIWKDCTRYYSPSIITLRKFVWSFTRLRDIESAYMTLQHMVTLASRESASLRISAAGRYESSRLDIPIPSINELPSEIFGLKASECSLKSLHEGTVKTKVVLGENCMDQSSRKKQSDHNIDKNLILGRFVLNPFHVPTTTDIFFPKTLGSRISNEVEKGRIDPQMFPSSAHVAGIDNQYLAVKQEEFAERDLENISKGSGFGMLKETVSVPVKNVLRWSFNNIIHACAQVKNCELAEHLFLKMHDLGLEPSRDTYDGFVKAIIYGKGVSYGMKVIKFMEEMNIEPYNDTLATLSIGHSKNFELDIAEALLEKISDSLPKYIHPFNAFLAACDVMDQPERAVFILAKLKHLNIKSNIRTYELLFSLFGNVNVPYEKGNILSHVDVAKRINTIEMDMIRSGVHHSYTSMKNLIRALGAEGMKQEMMRYLNVAENTLWCTNSYQKIDMYNIVLHALVKAKDSHTAIEVFKNMRSCSFPANVATYNIMIECCSILTCFKSACALLSMMLRDGFYPQILTFTALTKVLLANYDFDGALSILDQAISSGIQLDIQLFNTTLREAYIKGRIDIIELILELTRREKIQPDPSTCGYTFSAYVECGFHTTAMEALQVLSMRMISLDDSILQEERAAFEDLVHSEDPDAESRIAEIFKDNREFLATALLNLRWCAINGFSVSWFPEENPWARRLSSSYATRKGALLE